MGKKILYEGKVHGFTAKTEPYGQSSRQVWTFQLLRFNDELGNPLPPIPVEMKGSRFEGFINDEDTVRIEGEWREGDVLKINELFNVTTNIKVKRKRWFF